MDNGNHRNHRYWIKTCEAQKNTVKHSKTHVHMETLKFLNSTKVEKAPLLRGLTVVVGMVGRAPKIDPATLTHHNMHLTQ